MTMANIVSQAINVKFSYEKILSYQKLTCIYLIKKIYSRGVALITPGCFVEKRIVQRIARAVPCQENVRPVPTLRK